MKIEGLGAGFVDGYKAGGGSKQHCTECESLKAEVERLKDELSDIKDKTKTFVMKIEPHEPDNINRPCLECCLVHGPMCLDRSYCIFKETGKVWRKMI